MQKYDENIKKMLILASKITEQISNVLKKDDFDVQDLNKVADIYKRREDLLNSLKKEIDSENGTKFVSDNKEYWDESIAKILSNDKINMDILQKKTGEAGDKVRNIYKNKSLLIYTK